MVKRNLFRPEAVSRLVRNGVRSRLIYRDFNVNMRHAIACTKFPLNLFQSSNGTSSSRATEAEATF